MKLMNRRRMILDSASGAAACAWAQSHIATAAGMTATIRVGPGVVPQEDTASLRRIQT